MRKIINFTLLSLLLSNLILVSAWAKPCLHNMSESSHISKMEVSMNGNMSCHQSGKEKSNNKHCKGLCFCSHAFASSSLYLAANNSFKIVSNLKQSFLINYDNLTSINQVPPTKPPKFIS